MAGLPPGFQINEALSRQMGTTVAVNPATGQRIRLKPVGKLTEDQGKSQGYAKLMAKAEDNYQRARAEGYDPGSLRNAAASVVEDFKLPFIGQPFSGVGPVIRDDVSDRGKAAERLWQDAQLKTMTGAGQSEGERVENPRTYFAQFGDGADDDKYAVRATAYEAAKTRAGPEGGRMPHYPAQGKKTGGKAKGGVMAAPPPAQRKAGQRYKTPRGNLVWTGTGWRP